MKVIVTGASGMLGTALLQECLSHFSEVVAIFGTSSISVEGVKSYSCDLASRGLILEIIRSEKPQVVIHAAAITSHKYCEQYPDKTQAVHVDSSREIAKGCKEIGAHLVYISSESVYGESESEHKEDATCSPISVYSKTKLDGENASMEAGMTSILRTTVVGFSPKRDRSLMDWAVAELGKGNEITGFDDVLFSPISAHDLSSVIVSFILSKIEGIWNVGSSDSVTKYQFLRMVAELYGFDKELVRKGSILKSTLTGAKCLNATLNTGKLEKVLPQQVRTVEQTLKTIREKN